MKKHIMPLFLLILALCLLCGCTSYDAPTGSARTVDRSGNIWIIDHEAKTITCNGTECIFGVSDAGSEYPGITVYYPDGAVYYSSKSSSGWSNDYDETKHIPGDTIVNMIRPYYTGEPSKIPWPNVIMCVLCLGMGFVNCCFPEFAWRWSHMFKAWQYESVEPSDAGLVVTRIGGIIIMLLGIILLFALPS